jgi:hypothetical protein
VSRGRTRTPNSWKRWYQHPHRGYCSCVVRPIESIYPNKLDASVRRCTTLLLPNRRMIPPPLLLRRRRQVMTTILIIPQRGTKVNYRRSNLIEDILYRYYTGLPPVPEQDDGDGAGDHDVETRPVLELIQQWIQDGVVPV